MVNTPYLLNAFSRWVANLNTLFEFFSTPISSFKNTFGQVTLYGAMLNMFGLGSVSLLDLLIGGSITLFIGVTFVKWVIS